MAEVIRGEGEARVSVRGLTPQTGIHYVLWLNREGTEDYFRVGETLIQPDGTATLDLVLPDAIPNRGWNMAFISAESSPDIIRPGPRRVLAGRFPKPVTQGTIPLGLPNTGLGGGSGPSPFPIIAIGLTFGAAVLLRRSSRLPSGKVL